MVSARVRSTETKNKFEVIELTHTDFLDFAALYKTNLTLPKKDTAKESFKWTDIHWLRYSKQKKRKILLKLTLDEEVPFRSIDLKKKRNSKLHLPLKPPAYYNSTLPISAEKKRSDGTSSINIAFIL